MNDSNYESADKMVSHPSHYQSRNGLEVIDIIESFTDGLNGIEAVDTANVIKYICRWKHKNGIQDIEKAIWYATHLLNHLKSIDERDVAEGVDDSVIEENQKNYETKLLTKVHASEDDEYNDSVGSWYSLTDSKMNCIKVLDSLFYHGENSLTLIFAFYDDAKLFMTMLDNYFDKTNEAYYISADAILRMVGFESGDVSIGPEYHTIGWFNMNDISYYDNIVELSNPQPLFSNVNDAISEIRRNNL